jgi:large subunit ribosomal protein L25
VNTVALSAVPRSDFGKGAARRIRRGGAIPAVIYGEGTDLRHVALPEHDLDLALRRPRVVLEVAIDGSTVLVKPRDVQRDPVRRTLEHVDLVVITKDEAKERGAMADAIAAAAEAAAEAGIDAAAAIQALEEAVAQGEDPAAAAAHAVEDVEHQAEAFAEANVHAEEVEAAEAEAAAEEAAAEGEAVAPTASGADEGTDAAAAAQE